MRALSAPLVTALAGNVFTLGDLLELKVRGVWYYFTNREIDVLWGGHIYVSSGALLERSRVRQGADGTLDDLDVRVMHGGADRVSPNIQDDGGFNAWTSPTASPYWILYNNGADAGNALVRSNAGDAKFGVYCARVTVPTGSTATIGIRGHSIRGGWVPLKTYCISFWCRATGAAVGHSMSLRWNTQPATTTWLENPAISSTWQRYVARITMGATVEAAGQLYLDAGATGAAAPTEIYFDGVQVEEGTAATQFQPATAEEIGGVSWVARYLAGDFAGAPVRLLLAYFSDATTVIDAPLVFEGEVGPAQFGSTEGRLVVRSLGARLELPAPRNFYATGCQFALYDAGCGLARPTTWDSRVTAAASSTTVIKVASLSAATDYFKLGMVEVLSGGASGYPRTITGSVDSGSEHHLTVAPPLPAAPGAGNGVRIRRGCAKTAVACDGFGRLVAMLAAPMTPREDQVGR